MGIFFVSICSILGFILSLYVAIKSKSISKELKEISTKKIYACERTTLIKHFEGYRMSIIEDGNRNPTMRHNLLTEVYAFEKQYFLLLNCIDKITLVCFKGQLKRQKPNYNKICTYIDYFVAKFNVKEE